MKYLPILEELFSSDSICFLIIGLVLAAFVGVRMKDTKKKRIGIIVSFVVYVICEVMSNIHMTFMTDLLLLFAGTIALGCLIGFGISLLVSEERTKK